MLSTRAATYLLIGLTGYLILLAGCGGDGGTTSGECQPVLNAAASPPGTVLTVDGLPAAMTAPTGSITTDGQTIPAQLTRDPAGTVTLVVPLHPSGRASGGDATLTVSGNGSTCRAVRLSISALPSAPGAAAAATQALQDSVATAGAAFGLTPEQLRGDPDAVPQVLRGLQIAQRMLDHPDNPNSLTAILAGTAPVLDGRPVDAALLDGLMASTGLRAALEEYAAATAAALAPQDSDTELASVVGARAAPGATPQWLTAAVPLAPTTIESGYALAYWMKRQDAAARLSGESAQRVVALFETFLATVAAAGPVGKGISIAGTVALNSLYMTNAYLAAALPFELSDMSVEAFPTVFAEDQALTGQWRARVTARNKGATLTLPVALAQAAGSSVPWGKGLAKIAETHPVMKAFIEELLTKVSEAVGSALGGAFNVQTGVLLVPQQQWTGIDVSSMRFTRRALSAPGVVELSPTLWQDYQPLAPGETLLTISTFAATINSALERSVPIRVQQIAITVEAERAQMRPGTEQQLIVGVAGAQDLNVTWSASCGTVVAEPGAFATYTAPATPGTCTVTARHVTKTQRSGSVQIQIANVVTVEVTPRSTTLAPGELRTFTAAVEGAQNTAVTWAASRGSITQEGVFTAPQETGLVTITATSVEDPTKSGTAQVQVAAAPPRYRVVALGGDLESGYNQPRGVDSEGRVLTSGGLWQNGSIILPSSPQRTFRGIASDGVIFGYDYDVLRSFVYSGGTITDYRECQLRGIGPGGRVTGIIVTAPEGRPVEGICQGSGGSYSIIHGLPEGPPPTISAPNASGDAVGSWQYQGVIFRGGSMIPLPPGAYTQVSGLDINDAGDILGGVTSGSQYCAAIWRGGGSPEVIGPCSATEWLEAVAINNAGIVLAQLVSETGRTYVLGLGDQWVEVESLIVERPADFVLERLFGIGESGHLFGQGTDGRGYVLIPVNSLLAGKVSKDSF